VKTDIVEFAVPLKQGPTEGVETVSMVMIQSSMLSSTPNPEENNSTDVDYDDSEVTLP